MTKIIVDAQKSKYISLNFKELYEYRELLWVLAYRDLKVRYAQTVLGFAWAILQPLFTVMIFTLVFKVAIRVDTGTIPYPLYALVGMWAWQYFAFVMGGAGNSIINTQNLISKIYFPRLIIPLSKALVGLVDFGINFVFVVILLLVYGFLNLSNLIFLPLAILFLLLSAWGVGIWLSALIIRFRDFQQISAFALQIGVYVSPIAYPSKLIPEAYQFYYFLNPMTGVIDSFRFCVLGEKLSPFVWVSLGMASLIFVSSLFYFRKIEGIMADII